MTFTLASGELGACLRLNGRVDFAFRPLEKKLWVAEGPGADGADNL